MSDHVEILKAIRATFRGDIAASEKALARKGCKDPAWHQLRVKVRTEDVEALTAAIDALSVPA